MSTRICSALLGAIVLSGSVFAAEADLHAIRKEPVYQSKAPRYCVLVFGTEAKHAVWLVHDGDTLYIDRNANGDLTDAGEMVAAVRDQARSADASFHFKIGDLRVGQRLHKGLTVFASPLSLYSDNVQKKPNAAAALAADPQARVYHVALDVEKPGYKGLGIGGRLVWSAGVVDHNGALLFADKPADAPVIHFDGPLQVTFYDAAPTLKLGRDNEVVLVVGTPGRGPGSFAMLGYEVTIPEGAHPRLEVLFQAAQVGDPPLRQMYELKKRC